MLEKRRKEIKGRGQRSSVSAEVYGAFNKKEDFVAKIVKKTPEEIERITKKVNQSFSKNTYYGLDKTH